MILAVVVRSQVRCDQCLSAYIHADSDVDAFLIDHGWRVEHWFAPDGTPVDLHKCPRCVRKSRTAS